MKEVRGWDTSFLGFLAALWKTGVNEYSCTFVDEDMPAGMRKLMSLARAVPEVPAEEGVQRDSFLRQVGLGTMRVFQGIRCYHDFIGTLFLDLGRLLLGRASWRGKDFWLALQQAGPQAVPIVTLLAFLTGLIIAFIGAIQLQKLAADIFVADLVGLSMTRELAAVMTGVIMAGRTGAAYAAQIGSMRVNEEVDALQSLGISPIQFLVLPKVIALVLMMPLLTAFANVVSILGGLLVAVGVTDVTMAQFHVQIVGAVSSVDVLVGLFKSMVFGVIIALSGCYRGLRCGKDAASVGRATTSAVVTAITWIVVCDALFAVVFHILGI
ncbi:MAG: ABC transporter permease [Opitutales bacterium]|nr:ABC transporter permease [Opitutales bacterium]MCH8540557.1 ABC transporter permease [Opitutales bacterium]